MSEVVEVKGVVLRGDDLKVVWSAWPSVNRANNQRLFPVAAGTAASMVAAGFFFQPTLIELLGFLGPLLAGWFAFIWATNKLFMGAYKRGYETSPVGTVACNFTFDTEGMRQDAPPLFSGAFKWASFADVREDSDGFRFWMTPYMAVFLPVRYLDPAQRDALRDMVDGARKDGRIKGLQDG